MLKYHKPLTNGHKLLTSAIKPYFRVCIRTTFICLLLHTGTKFHHELVRGTKKEVLKFAEYLARFELVANPDAEFMYSGMVHMPFSYSSARPGFRIRVRQICHYYTDVNIHKTIQLIISIGDCHLFLPQDKNRPVFLAISYIQKFYYQSATIVLLYSCTIL
jgi:hypothetical protein